MEKEKKARKGKYTMTISIGFTALILTMVMFTQFKTVDETDITAIETMRETELRSELTDWKAKYEEIDEKLADTESKIHEYNVELQNNADSSKILEQEVAEAQNYLGYTNVEGQGITITLSDNDMTTIEYSDLLSLVNELNGAGAEAISINDERIVSTSEIVLVGYRIILVNTRKISGPYVIKAIGDKKYLESAITIKGGYKDLLEDEGKSISYTTEDHLSIPAYQGNMSLQYSKIQSEEEETK